MSWAHALTDMLKGGIFRKIFLPPKKNKTKEKFCIS